MVLFHVAFSWSGLYITSAYCNSVLYYTVKCEYITLVYCTVLYIYAMNMVLNGGLTRVIFRVSLFTILSLPIVTFLTHSCHFSRFTFHHIVPVLGAIVVLFHVAFSHHIVLFLGESSNLIQTHSLFFIDARELI